MGSVTEDRWHVRMAPGEVKVLTLDQIDDLFRLEMIDGDTLVRQDGTEQWLPLRVVAGLDDEASEEVAPAPAPPVRSAPPPPPPPARSAPTPPPPPPSLPPPSVTAAPFSHSPSFAPPPVHSAPPPPSARAASVAPPIVASVAPLPFTPPVLPTRTNRIEVLLIGLAVLLGLLVTLQRNGALAALFASAGQGAAYARLEASLGGPGFGTPRAVDALVNQTRAPR